MMSNGSRKLEYSRTRVRYSQSQAVAILKSASSTLVGVVGDYYVTMPAVVCARGNHC